jgi:hypothetical protein
MSMSVYLIIVVQCYNIEKGEGITMNVSYTVRELFSK